MRKVRPDHIVLDVSAVEAAETLKPLAALLTGNKELNDDESHTTRASHANPFGRRVGRPILLHPNRDAISLHSQGRGHG